MNEPTEQHSPGAEARRATSTKINEIALALAKAQAEMKAVVAKASNPFYKSKYADLASVADEIRLPLAKNNLAVWVDFEQNIAEFPDWVTAIATLLHGPSGQWLRSRVSVRAVAKGGDSPSRLGAHDIASAMTFAQRYAVRAVTFVVPTGEDDDGNAAVGRERRTQEALATGERRRAAAEHPDGRRGMIREDRKWQASMQEALRVVAMCQELGISCRRIPDGSGPNVVELTPAQGQMLGFTPGRGLKFELRSLSEDEWVIFETFLESRLRARLRVNESTEEGGGAVAGKALPAAATTTEPAGSSRMPSGGRGSMTAATPPPPTSEKLPF